MALPLENNTVIPQRVFFTLKNAAINRIRYYWVVDDSIVFKGETGDNFTFKERPYPFCNFTFPVQISSRQRGVLFLEMDKRNENFFCGFDLSEERTFHRFEVRTYWIFGIFVGIIILTIAVNLFLFFLLKDSLHLWYGLYALSNLFLLLSFDGLDFQFIYPEAPFLSNISRYVTTGMTYILLFQLLIVFIKEGKSSVSVKILIRSFQIIHLMLLVTSIVTFWYFQYSEWIKIFLFRSLSLLSVVSLIALLVVSFRHYRRGHKASLLFFIAIFILLSGSIEYVLNLNGWRTGLLLFNSVIPSNMQICVILEVLLVFFAVFYRYKLYRDEGSKLRYKLLETESKWREQEIESRNEERKSIAMDIHDGIGSRLFGTRMRLESILLKQGLDDQEFNSISGELRLISKELKNVILSLSKDENSARAQITALAEKLSDLFSHSSMRMDFKIELHDEEFQSGFILDVQLIFLELANNVLKYSNCEKVEAALLVKENQVILCWVECPEISTHCAGDGLGLRSISKRFKRWQGHREDLLFPYHYKLIFQKQWVVKKDN